jgi:hypothetical protein
VARPETGLVNLGDERQPEYAWDPMVADALEYLGLVMYPLIIAYSALIILSQAITIKRAKEKKCFLSCGAHTNCNCAEKGYTPDLCAFVDEDRYPEYPMATLQQCEEAYHYSGASTVLFSILLIIIKFKSALMQSLKKSSVAPSSSMQMPVVQRHCK